MSNQSDAVLTVGDARARGISWDRLQRRDWERVGPGQYARPHVADAHTRLLAASRRLPTGAALAGRSAGWLHGLDLPPCDPIEVIAPIACHVSARAGIRLRRAQLEAGEIVDRRGLPVTAPLRTVIDLAWRLPLIEAVAAVDGALHQSLVGLDELRQAVASREGRQGVRQLRRVADLAEPWPSRRWRPA